jgi:hypothetical protein
MITIVDKVKLVVVRRDSPDIETELDTYPLKDAAVWGSSTSSRRR